ncbi:MAG: hypothetical protein WDO71_00585 [Bacteroidota bacterium]
MELFTEVCHCLLHYNTGAVDGDTTGQLIISSIHPAEIEFERNGNTFTFSAATHGENYKSVSKEMQLNDETFVGLYLCSHVDTVVEESYFQ